LPYLFRAGEHYIPLRVTCGFASAGNPENVNGKGLLKQVYIALKNAKNNSFDRYNYYEPSMEQETQRRLHLVRRLRADFANRKLQVWYQPQVELSKKNCRCRSTSTLASKQRFFYFSCRVYPVSGVFGAYCGNWLLGY
jgi:response regulator receiver modulated diguanylate cyclase/phosphodiesterase